MKGPNVFGTILVGSAVVLGVLLYLEGPRNGAATPQQEHAVYLRRSVPREGPMLYSAQHTLHSTRDGALTPAGIWEAPWENYWVADNGDSLYAVWRLPVAP